MTLFVDMDEVFADAFNAHITLYNAEFSENLTEMDCMGERFGKVFLWNANPA